MDRSEMREIMQHLYAHHGIQNTDAYLATDDGVQRENKKRGERLTQEDGREQGERLTQEDGTGTFGTRSWKRIRRTVDTRKWKRAM